MPELLRVENLSAGYGEAVILDGVSLALAAGETLALLGRNGTGKTTLINTLAGATRQHGGTITLGGHRAAQAAVACARRGRHRLGAAGAQHLQVADGAGKPDGGRPAGPLDAGAGLRDVSAAGGTQGTTWARSCRAASSRCWRWAARWSLNPRLLLLDEPLEGLAPIIVEELLKAIARITRGEGLSAIIVEQHPQAILAISHRAVVLDHGAVVHSGRPRN